MPCVSLQRKSSRFQEETSDIEMQLLKLGLFFEDSIYFNGTAMRNYTREWQYDSVGNILSLIHNANGNAWTRTNNYAANNNHLSSTTVGQTTVNYTYSAHGSMTSMPHLQGMQWDFAEKLSHITRGTTEAYYNYDGGGQRVRKVVEKNGVTETRLYLGGFEIWRKTVNGILNTERETLHVMDDSTRVAVVETLTVDNSSAVANPVPVQRYQLDNHLGSASLELDDLANVISYEEYYPYGETSYRAGRNIAETGLKRYRYIGKEKDEESSLYYCEQRYSATHIMRWLSTDPLGLIDGINLYAYVNGNPLSGVDPSGTKTENLPESNDKVDYNLPDQKISVSNISSVVDENQKIITTEYEHNTLNLSLTNFVPANFQKVEINENEKYSEIISNILYTEAFSKAWIGYGKPYKTALKLIEKHRIDIKQSAEKWDVDPKAIASVIFQENFYGFWATAKNIIALPKLVFKDYTYSFGLTEMQINTAVMLLRERGEKATVWQSIRWLQNDAHAIDLAAQYLAKIQKDIGDQEPYVLAQAYNLGIDNVKKGKYSYVGNRSKYFQKEIEKALKYDK